MRNEKMKQSFPQKTESFHYAVQNALDRLPEKEEAMKKKAFFKRGLVLAVAAVMVLGATVYAATEVITTHIASSRSRAEYTDFPSEKQLIKDIGYAPDLVDAFANGYQFYEASHVKNDVKDENGKRVDKYDSITARYEREGKRLLLSARQQETGMEDEGLELTDTYQGISLYYQSYRSKAVPAGYEMTEEDEEAKASGEVIFSYGTDDVEVSQVQSVSFEKDGINYTLLEMEENISKDELLQMAKEIVEK